MSKDAVDPLEIASHARTCSFALVTDAGNGEASELPKEETDSGEKERWADMGDAEEKMWWNGRWYPKAREADGTVCHATPDAHPLPTNTLPHLLKDPGLWCPCACASPPVAEVEVTTKDSLEEIGRRKGIVGFSGEDKEESQRGEGAEKKSDGQLALEEGVGSAVPRCFELAIHPRSGRSCIRHEPEANSAKARPKRVVRIALDDETVHFNI